MVEEKFNLKSFCTVMMVLVCGISFAKAQDFDGLCPKEIATEQRIISEAKGFQSFQKATHAKLSEVSFSDGNPLDQLILKYDKSETSHKVESYLWKFNSPSIWVQCGYFGTTVKLSKPLDTSLKSCEVFRNPGNGLVNRITCRE
ncbi:MAG: STY0301 family protein [Candidatus Methylumidiphilus sp.]